MKEAETESMRHAARLAERAQAALEAEKEDSKKRKWQRLLQSRFRESRRLVGRVRSCLHV